MLLITDYYELGSLYDFLQVNVVDHEAAVSIILGHTQKRRSYKRRQEKRRSYKRRQEKRRP